MARKTFPLSDTEIKNAKPRDTQYTLGDGDGLYLLILPTKKNYNLITGKPKKDDPSSKLWRYKYKLAGKIKLMSLGAYPDVGLAAARIARDNANKRIKAGLNPASVCMTKRNAPAVSTNTFEYYARAWHRDQLAGNYQPEGKKGKKITKWSPEHADLKLHNLEKDIFLWLKGIDIADIKPAKLLEILRRVWERGAIEGAHRLRYDCQLIFEYATALEATDKNPAFTIRKLLPLYRNEHYPAYTDPKDVARLLKAIYAYEGGLVVKSALKLAMLFFLRPGELRAAEWSEFRFNECRWYIPGPRMKMKEAHIVPLSTQAIEILQTLQHLTGAGKYVFPGERSIHRCMSENAVNVALRTMGFSKEEIVGHGFRATARTLGAERLKIKEKYLEIQLSHKTLSPNGTAYDRAAFIDDRTIMMQDWADYLDDLRAS